MYKNWKAINGISDKHFMYAFALLDLETEFGKKMAEKFPEYFLHEKPEQAGPVPLSAIREYAINNPDHHADEGCFQPPQDFLFTQGAVEYFGIPVILFAGHKETLSTYKDQNVKMLPKELEKAQKATLIGEQYEWRSTKLILLENYDDGVDHEIYFTPAKTILVDLKWHMET